MPLCRQRSGLRGVVTWPPLAGPLPRYLVRRRRLSPPFSGGRGSGVPSRACVSERGRPVRMVQRSQVADARSASTFITGNQPRVTQHRSTPSRRKLRAAPPGCHRPALAVIGSGSGSGTSTGRAAVPRAISGQPARETLSLEPSPCDTEERLRPMGSRTCPKEAQAPPT